MSPLPSTPCSISENELLRQLVVKKTNASFGINNFEKSAQYVVKTIMVLVTPARQSQKAWTFSKEQLNATPTTPISSKLKQKAFMKDISDFVVIKRLGRGISGTVYLARDKPSGSYVAVKAISKRASLPDETPDTVKYRNIRMELKTFRAVEGCAQLLQLHWAMETEVGIFFVTEVAAMNLKGYSEKYGISPEEINFCGREVILGLKFLHQKQLVHRDVKIENILITHKLGANGETRELDQVKLADFGLACEKNRASGVCGTPAYMSPEVLEKGQAVPASDFWSLGITLIWLQQKDYPFGDCEEDVKDGIRDPVLSKCVFARFDQESEEDAVKYGETVKPLSQEDVVFRELINKLLIRDEKVRDKFIRKHLMKHEYFKWEKPQVAVCKEDTKEIPKSTWGRAKSIFSNLVGYKSLFFSRDAIVADVSEDGPKSVLEWIKSTLSQFMHYGSLFAPRPVMLDDVSVEDVPVEYRDPEVPIFALMSGRPRPLPPANWPPHHI
ncbi:Serine/threonine kinase [Dinochytrium kinnereticum]|nr:Serine/threonine kinase [Dinochytrium kinnereticum]